jgi:transcriptional regulator with XRE-family HTH domain
MLRVGHEPKLTQRQAADDAGLSLNRYWMIENGHATPDPKEQQAIAKVFGVPIEDLFPERPSAEATSDDDSSAPQSERRNGERRAL